MESEKRLEEEVREPANGETRKPIDPRILHIAQAIGRQLAREHARARYPNAANDNKPRR
jgi:hypothetical protein